MRLDGEQPYNHNFAHEIVSKEIRPSEENLIIDMFKVEKEAVWDEKYGHLSSVEEILGEHTNSSQCTYVGIRNSVNGIQNDDEQQMIGTNSNELVSERHLSAEKTVTEIHLPENHIVKDICVDEAVRSVEKKLVENEVEHKTSSGIDYSVGNKDTEKKPFPESSSSVGEQLNFAEQIVDDKSHELISSKQSISPKDHVEEPQQVSQDSFSSGNDPKQSVDERPIDEGLLEECSPVEAVPSDTSKINECSWMKETPINGLSKDMTEDYPTVVGVISETKESNQSSINVGGLDVTSNNISEEGFNAAVHSGAQTLSQTDCTKENPSNGSSSNPFESNSGDSKNLAGCDIDGLDTCDLIPRAGETVRTNDGEKAIESGQPGSVQNDHFVEGAVTDGGTNSARTFVNQNRADFNLCGPMISSGPIASSGHIPYSGSISLRSDSSTTSTRSFAFPILQTEWNSSPVKMAKAKRRRFRKYRGWRWGVLCCKF